MKLITWFFVRSSSEYANKNVNDQDKLPITRFNYHLCTYCSGRFIPVNLVIQQIAVEKANYTENGSSEREREWSTSSSWDRTRFTAEREYKLVNFNFEETETARWFRNRRITSPNWQLASDRFASKRRGRILKSNTSESTRNRNLNRKFVKILKFKTFFKVFGVCLFENIFLRVSHWEAPKSIRENIGEHQRASEYRRTEEYSKAPKPKRWGRDATSNLR